MTTCSTFEGREVVSVCLEDIETLSTPPKELRAIVRRNARLGDASRAKDFVPANSTESVINRRKNSYSRKATVVRLDMLPPHLVQELKEGNHLFLVVYYFLHFNQNLKSVTT